MSLNIKTSEREMHDTQVATYNTYYSVPAYKNI
jgi:hypothetical protein